MNNCVIKSNCDTSTVSSYYDSVFGIGTDYSSNEINVNMNEESAKMTKERIIDYEIK